MQSEEDHDMGEILQVTVWTIGGGEAKLDLKGSHSLEDVRELSKEALGIAADNEVALIQNQRELPSVGLAKDEIADDAHLSIVRRIFPVALLFPERSNHTGILCRVLDAPNGMHMLDQAKSILGYDLLEVGNRDICKPMFYQPAMYVVGLAAANLLRCDNPSLVASCQALGGLSLGFYAALTVAGVFDFETGLKLVKVRGEGMEKATALGDQASMEVDGIGRDVLEKLCKGCAEKHGLCQISNVLFPGGFQCGGTRHAILKVKEKVEEKGGCAKVLQKVLQFEGAFHTPFMEPAKKQLMAELYRVRDKMQPPRCYVYGLGDTPIGPASSVDDIIDSLGNEVTTCGDWEASVRAMINDGVMEFYECGPAKQLKAMMKRIDPTAWHNTFNIDLCDNFISF